MDKVKENFWYKYVEARTDPLSYPLGLASAIEIKYPNFRDKYKGT